MASFAEQGTRALITHFDVGLGGGMGIATLTIPDEMLSYVGKFVFAVATAVVTALISGAIRSWQDRRRHRRPPRPKDD